MGLKILLNEVSVKASIKLVDHWSRAVIQCFHSQVKGENAGLGKY